MKTVRIIWRSLQLILHLLLGIVLNLILPKHRTKNHEKLPNMVIVSWWHQRLCGILHLRVIPLGTKPTRPSLLVSNHISWLDISVISSLLHTSFLSKHEVKTWPLIGWLAASAGTIFIKRGSGETQQVQEAIVKRLNGDRMLAIFPEGTTSDGHSVRNFFPRLFSAAMHAEVPILPIALDYQYQGKKDHIAPYIDDQSLISNLLALMARPSSRVYVSFGKSIHYQDKDRKTVAEIARQQILTMLSADADKPDD